MMRYTYRKYEDLKNVVSMELVEKDADFIYEYFMQNRIDILYIMKDEKLEAIASPGDVHKFYLGRGKYEFAINKQFSFLEGVDYDKALEIFERIPTIHEIPVVINGKFEGVILDGQCKEEEEWSIIRDDLQRCKKSKRNTEWLSVDLLEWKSHFPEVKLFIYYIPSDKYILPEIREEIRRSMYDDKYDRMLEAEKRKGFTRLEYDKMHVTGQNGIWKYRDMDTATCKISQGNRNVPNANADAAHKVFVIGPCTMFGVFVDDMSTIEYFLQDKINKEKKSYQVCNCSGMGTQHAHHRLFTEAVREYDIVILALREKDYPYGWLDSRIKKNFRSDLSVLFDKQDDIQKMFLDCPAHCNDTMNKRIAELFFEDIKDSLSDEESTKVREAMQDYYISFDIRDYFFDFIKQYKNDELGNQDIIGSIVMNCNPFTLGHRFLIEKALEKVDFLYIFVVEENRSMFSFEDRMQMVKEGVKDLERVRVIPSGKYIISKDTFAQYFEKENVTEVESMDYDVRIFGEIVAPGFHISYRFVGEEPFDFVTNQYNRTLKSILPQYGVKVEEIPRKNIEGRKEVINATAVRKLIQCGGAKDIEQYCPESTIKYLESIQQRKDIL